MSSSALLNKSDFSVGEHNLTLTVTDNDGNKDSDELVVTITPAPIVNQEPIANEENITISEDNSIDINLTGSDNEGSSLTYSLVSNPSNGTLSGTLPNIIYTPTTDYNGIDSFTFRVNDGSLDSNIATIEINITAINDVPIANEQNLTTLEDTALDINLTGSDIEGSPLIYSIESNPIYGTLSGTAPNLTYTPTADYNGDDSFTFKVNDGLVDSAIVNHH